MVLLLLVPVDNCLHYRMLTISPVAGRPGLFDCQMLGGAFCLFHFFSITTGVWIRSYGSWNKKKPHPRGNERTVVVIDVNHQVKKW